MLPGHFGTTPGTVEVGSHLLLGAAAPEVGSRTGRYPAYLPLPPIRRYGRMPGAERESPPEDRRVQPCLYGPEASTEPHAICLCEELAGVPSEGKGPAARSPEQVVDPRLTVEHDRPFGEIRPRPNRRVAELYEPGPLAPDRVSRLGNPSTRTGLFRERHPPRKSRKQKREKDGRHQGHGSHPAKWSRCARDRLPRRTGG